jgi:hypothetical protein
LSQAVYGEGVCTIENKQQQDIKLPQPPFRLSPNHQKHAPCKKNNKKKQQKNKNKKHAACKNKKPKKKKIM